MGDREIYTYSSEAKGAEHTPRDAALDAAVLDLRGPRVAVHLAQLQRGAVADRLWQRRVADQVAEGLSISIRAAAGAMFVSFEASFKFPFTLTCA